MTGRISVGFMREVSDRTVGTADGQYFVPVHIYPRAQNFSGTRVDIALPCVDEITKTLHEQFKNQILTKNMITTAVISYPSESNAWSALIHRLKYPRALAPQGESKKTTTNERTVTYGTHLSGRTTQRSETRSPAPLAGAPSTSPSSTHASSPCSCSGCAAWTRTPWPLA